MALVMSGSAWDETYVNHLRFSSQLESPLHMNATHIHTSVQIPEYNKASQTPQSHISKTEPFHNFSCTVNREVWHI